MIKEKKILLKKATLHNGQLRAGNMVTLLNSNHRNNELYKEKQIAQNQHTYKTTTKQ